MNAVQDSLERQAYTAVLKVGVHIPVG